MVDVEAVPDRLRFISDSGLMIRGVVHRGQKTYWHGTHRAAAPSDTLNAIRSVLPAAGVTRLADITGLDRVGIPVTLAIRPNGLTLSVSTGKGFTTDAAMVSGAMEAIELSHAETCELPTFRASYREVSERQAVVSVETLPRARHAPFSLDWPYAWTNAWDVVAQREVGLPVTTVHMGDRDERTRDLASFYCTSNGLASGNSLVEAISHALCEVIERDALTCHKQRTAVTGRLPPVVAQESIEFTTVRRLLDTLAAADVVTVLFDCSTEIGVPTYMAYVGDLLWTNIGMFKGAGAHLDPEIAMIRALTEAIQGRAVYIAGARDDLFRSKVVQLQSENNGRAAQRLLTGLEPAVDAAGLSSNAGATFEADIETLLERLVNVGLRQVLVLDLSRSEFPVFVVKVVVPGLEAYSAANYEAGTRARAFARSGRP